MKILYVITKLELGGAQKVCLDLAGGFDREHEVWLMTGPGGMLNERARDLLGKRFVVNPHLVRQISPFKDLAAWIYMKKFMTSHGFDIVHTHSSKAGILGRSAAKKAGVEKVFHTVHGFPFNQFRNPLVNMVYRGLERIAVKMSSKLIAVTNEDIEYGIRNRVGSADDYVLIRAAADIEHFDSFVPDEEAIRREVGLTQGEKTVIQVSCFKPQKDPLRFVEMAAETVRMYAPQKVRFLLVGDGVLRDDIEELVKKMHMEENIILLGWKQDIRPYLAVSDVFTLTSLWEGLPIAIVEAFAMKKPVVVTAVNGNREIVEDEMNGYLYSPGDVVRGAELIISLLRDENDAKKKGIKGYEKIVEEFSVKKMISDTNKLYLE